MTIQQAFKAVTGLSIEDGIEKAMEGGFKNAMGGAGILSEPNLTEGNLSIYFLDPLFWQSLGKAMGWNQGDIGVCSSCGSRGEAENHVKCNCSEPLPEIIEEWLYQWHRFIDHLAEGKDAE